jgi:hypothetical protein
MDRSGNQQSPCLTDLHWAAGVLEAHGCFSIEEHDSGPYSQLKFKSVERARLAEFLSAVGITAHITEAYRNGGASRQLVHSTTLRGSNLAVVLSAVVPLLRSPERKSEFANRLEQLRRRRAQLKLRSPFPIPTVPAERRAAANRLPKSDGLS